MYSQFNLLIIYLQDSLTHNQSNIDPHLIQFNNYHRHYSFNVNLIEFIGWISGLSSFLYFYKNQFNRIELIQFIFLSSFIPLMVKMLISTIGIYSIRRFNSNVSLFDRIYKCINIGKYPLSYFITIHLILLSLLSYHFNLDIIHKFFISIRNLHDNNLLLDSVQSIVYTHYQNALFINIHPWIGYLIALFGSHLIILVSLFISTVFSFTVQYISLYVILSVILTKEQIQSIIYYLILPCVCTSIVYSKSYLQKFIFFIRILVSTGITMTLVSTLPIHYHYNYELLSIPFEQIGYILFAIFIFLFSFFNFRKFIIFMTILLGLWITSQDYPALCESSPLYLFIFVLCFLFQESRFNPLYFALNYFNQILYLYNRESI